MVDEESNQQPDQKPGLQPDQQQDQQTDQQDDQQQPAEKRDRKRDRKPSVKPIRRGWRHSREAISQHSAAKRCKLSIPQYLDLQSSSEHLIALGCRRRRDAERRLEFQKRQGLSMEREHYLPWTYQNKLEIDDNNYESANEGNHSDDDEGNAKKPAASTTAGKSKPPSREVLSEDIRIYGDVGGIREDGFSKPPWPRQWKSREKLGKFNNSDKNWEIEHGDQIHPLAFSAARLSQAKRSKTKGEIEAINGKNLNVSSTDTSLSEGEVPRALLLRCWERAVHAASISVPAHCELRQSPSERQTEFRGWKARARVKNSADGDVFRGNVLGLGEDELEVGPFAKKEKSAVKEPTFVALQRETAKDRAATEEKCKTMGISLKSADLPSDLPKQSCPSCLRSFDTAISLSQHYFGGKLEGQGCCWRRIPEAQMDVIGRVLEGQIKQQIDELLGLVMDSAKDRVVEPADGQTKNKHRRLLNWYDILRIVEENMQSSCLNEPSQFDSRNGKHPIFETYERKEGSCPIVLNPTVLINVRQRLVDRYANLPP